MMRLKLSFLITLSEILLVALLFLYPIAGVAGFGIRAIILGITKTITWPFYKARLLFWARVWWVPGVIIGVWFLIFRQSDPLVIAPWGYILVGSVLFCDRRASLWGTCLALLLLIVPGIHIKVQHGLNTGLWGLRPELWLGNPNIVAHIGVVAAWIVMLFGRTWYWWIIGWLGLLALTFSTGSLTPLAFAGFVGVGVVIYWVLFKLQSLKLFHHSDNLSFSLTPSSIPQETSYAQREHINPNHFRKHWPLYLVLLALGLGVVWVLFDFLNDRLLSRNRRTDAPRFLIWLTAWQAFLEHWWSGLTGAGLTFNTWWQTTHHTTAIDHAHNWPLQLAAKYGIFGLAIWLWLSYQFTRLGWLKYSYYGLGLWGGVYLINTWDLSFWLASVLFPLMLYWGEVSNILEK